MKPMERGGEKGIMLEGVTEIDTVAKGLEFIIMAAMEREPTNEALPLVRLMHTTMRDAVGAETRLAADTKFQAAQTARGRNGEAGIVFEAIGYDQLSLVETALSVTSRNHSGAAVGVTALAMLKEFQTFIGQDLQ